MNKKQNGKMYFSIKGYTNHTNLSKDKFMWLTEAINNSIDSLNEDEENTNKEIKIIFNINSNLFTGDKNINKLSIDSVEVIDNGIGFTNDRYNSFCTLYKSKEKNGVNIGNGRIQYLIFKNIKIESIYKDNDVYKKRYFEFQKGDENDSIQKHRIEEIEQFVCRETKVSFYEYDDLQLDVDKEFLIKKISENIFYKLLICKEKLINVTLLINNLQEEKVEKININEFVNGNFQIEENILEIKDNIFKINILETNSDIVDHSTIYYLTKSRSIECKRTLLKYYNCLNNNNNVPNTKYCIFISSPVIDEIYIESNNTIKWKLLDNNLFGNKLDLENHLKTHIDNLIKLKNEKKFNEIKNEITNDVFNKIESLGLKKYSSRLLSEMRKALNDKSKFVSKDEIYKLRDYNKSRLINWFFQYDGKLKEYEKSLSLNEKIKIRKNEIRSNFIELFKNKMELIKEIKEMTETYKESNDKQKKRSTEKEIHNLIISQGTNGNWNEIDNSGLWLISNEMLESQYIASDISLKRNNIIQEKEEYGDIRPDIFLFRNSLNNDYSSYEKILNNIPAGYVYIVELKRIDRNNLEKPENDPVKQILNYINKIEKIDANNTRKIKLEEDKNKYVFRTFAICDIDDKYHNKLVEKEFSVYKKQNNYIKIGNLKEFNNLYDFSELNSEENEQCKIIMEVYSYEYLIDMNLIKYNDLIKAYEKDLKDKDDIF